MRTPKQFIIEGVDRMGKSTLIDGLLQELGYHLVVHYEKPKKLDAFAHHENSLLSYQMAAYQQMFRLIDAHRHNRVILDRAHLGELVYGPLYRKYDASYVLEMEQQIPTHDCRLVLLTTSDFSFIQDDGLSLDFSKKELEQDLFKQAFASSSIEDKVLVDVSNGRGGYKTPEQILAEVLRK